MELSRIRQKTFPQVDIHGWCQAAMFWFNGMVSCFQLLSLVQNPRKLRPRDLKDLDRGKCSLSLKLPPCFGGPHDQHVSVAINLHDHTCERAVELLILRQSHHATKSTNPRGVVLHIARLGYTMIGCWKRCKERRSHRHLVARRGQIPWTRPQD